MRKNLHKYSRNLSTIIIVILFSLSLWQLAAAGWIQGKAVVAQQLLQHSWQKTLLNTEKHDSNDHPATTGRPVFHKPWPWADTWPAAKLIVPQHDIEQIILAGDSGSSLAFGPGYSLAGAAPDAVGTTVISAHRDTHFQFLKDVKINDTIILQSRDKTVSYRVNDMQVVDSRRYVIQDDPDSQTLVLVTCYPFDAIMPGGTLRYMVYASKSMAQN